MDDTFGRYKRSGSTTSPLRLEAELALVFDFFLRRMSYVASMLTSLESVGATGTFI